MELNEWQTIIRAGFGQACKLYRGGDEWWPDQSQGTILAWAVALHTLRQRAAAGRLPAGRRWISASRGTNWETKSALLRAMGVGTPSEGEEYSTDRNVDDRFSAREYLLDFTVWPAEDAPVDIVLSMESECYSEFEVGRRVEPENGYAYDYYKLMLVPSPLRLFVCRTRRSAATLLANLEQITQNARDTGALRAADEVSVLIVPAANADRANTIAAVWSNRGRRFIEQRLDPAIAR